MPYSAAIIKYELDLSRNNLCRQDSVSENQKKCSKTWVMNTVPAALSSYSFEWGKSKHDRMWNSVVPHSFTASAKLPAAPCRRTRTWLLAPKARNSLKFSVDIECWWGKISLERGAILNSHQITVLCDEMRVQCGPVVSQGKAFESLLSNGKNMQLHAISLDLMSDPHWVLMSSSTTQTTCVTSTPEGVKFQARSLLLCYLTFFLHVLPRILYSLIWLNPTSDKTDLLHWIPENRTWAKASTFPEKSRLQKPQIIHLFSLSSFFLPSYKHTRGSNANAASAFPELSCHWVNLKFRSTGGSKARPLRLQAGLHVAVVLLIAFWLGRNINIQSPK